MATAGAGEAAVRGGTGVVGGVLPAPFEEVLAFAFAAIAVADFASDVATGVMNELDPSPALRKGVTHSVDT